MGKQKYRPDQDPWNCVSKLFISLLCGISRKLYVTNTFLNLF